MDTVLCIKLDGYTSQICEAQYHNGSIIVIKSTQFPLPDKCFEDNTILNQDALIATLKSQILSLGVSTKQVCFSISNKADMQHLLCILSGKTPKQYAQQYSNRFTSHALDPKERFLAYTVCNEFKSNGTEFADMIYLFTTNAIIATFNNIANMLGLELVGIVNEAYSIANLCYQHVLPNSFVLWLGGKSINQFGTQERLLSFSHTGPCPWLKDIPFNNNDGLAQYGYGCLVDGLIAFAGKNDTANMNRDETYRHRMTSSTYELMRDLFDINYDLFNDMTKATLQYKHEAVREATGDYLQDCISPQQFHVDNIYLFGLLDKMNYLKTHLATKYKVPVNTLKIKNIKVQNDDISACDIIGCACAANPYANMLNMPAYSNKSVSFIKKLFGKKE